MMLVWIPVLIVVGLFVAAAIAPFLWQNPFQGNDEDVVFHHHW